MRGNRLFVLLVLAAVGAAPSAGWAETSTEKRLRVLEDALLEAQKEIQRLRREVETQKQTTEGTKSAVEETRKAQAEQVKTVEEAKKAFVVPKWLQHVTLFGDVRFRFEGFYNQPSVDGVRTTANNRQRIRARLGLKAAFSDELSTTIRLATGNPNDPISTNITLGDQGTPKQINLDWAFITFTPGKTFGIRPGLASVSAGKFPNPAYAVSQMVFDEDLSPEGLNEQVDLLAKPYGALQQVRLNAMQWAEELVANGHDSYMFGWQVNPSFVIGRMGLDVGVGQWWYINADLIAQAANSNSSLRVTNLVNTETVDGETEITGYQSTFNMTNPYLALTFPEVVGRMPLRLYGEYVHNWGAATSASNGYLAGAKLGQTKLRGDWAFSGYWEYLEQEAALSVFTASDYGSGTNAQGPVVALEYQLLDPLTVSARNYFTNYIETPPSTTNPTLFRLQLDAIVRF